MSGWVKVYDDHVSQERELRAVVAFYERVNARAEADMLNGNPITGAHHRALESEIALVREKLEKLEW
jgi:hypothetical protein